MSIKAAAITRMDQITWVVKIKSICNKQLGSSPPGLETGEAADVATMAGNSIKLHDP